MSCPAAPPGGGGALPSSLPSNVRANISAFCQMDYTSLIPFIGSQIAEAKRPEDPSASLQSATERAQAQLVEKQQAFHARLAEVTGADTRELTEIIEELQSPDGYLSSSIAVAVQPLHFAQVRLAIYLASLGIVLAAVVLMYS